MFENLTSKFEEIFSSLKKAPSLNEAQVEEGLRKIRQALLEADVALAVAKELIKNIKPKAIGQEIIRSTTPGQMIVKVVFDEIVKILGDTQSKLNLNAVPPVCLMLVGLQGSGKTTTAAKLAKYLEQNNKKHVKVKVWERGAGLTKACGTAACATAVSGAVLKLNERYVDIEFQEGLLNIDWSADNNIYMTGKVSEVKKITVSI